MFDRKKPLADQIEARAQRKLKAKQAAGTNVYFGFGMFGLVGWSVAVPTLMAIALGMWLDQRWPKPYSWTLMLLFIGVTIGCCNAWYWLQRARHNHDSEKQQ